MLLFTDLSTYILKTRIFDDQLHYFCILFICKIPQKQRTNACFSFKNQVTPPIFKASGTEAFLLTRHRHKKHNKNAYQIKFSLRKEKD